MKIVPLISGLLLAAACSFQANAQTITAAEYFFDVDPGLGNGISLSMPTPAVELTITETISVASLTPGYHILFVRAQDSNGNWSLFELQEFEIDAITQAEYFFDVDPGQGNGTPFTISSPPSQVSLTETVSIAGLQPGYHILFVRSQDANGDWSHPELQEFVVVSPVQELEYFFDIDPGIGNGIALAIAPGQLSLTENISTASLDDGEHILFVRTRHEGEWAMFNQAAFYIQTRIIEAEYFIDIDPGFGNGTPITVPTPNYLVTVAPSINVGPLANGDHNLFVRTRDILGVWSFFEPVMFTVDNLLPIELMDFNAELVRDNTVALNWKTLHEVNSDFFSVQHSIDGSEFVEIGTVRGSGTSTIPREYSLFHQMPAEGINYYRLKQVDFDGEATFSEVVSVTLEIKGVLMVYPNPADADWFIEFPGSNGSQLKRFELFDTSGRKCMEFISEKAQLALTRHHLANGMYFLKVTSEDGETMVKKISFQ